MRSLLRKLEAFARTKFPKLYFYLVRRPRLYLAFSTERKLATSTKPAASQQASVLFFTTQKCASRYVSEVLAQMADAHGLVHADYDGYVTSFKVKSHKNPFQDAIHTAFQPRGFYYGPIGTLRNIPNMESYKVLLQLRDPRDLLTSLYFSTAYSHAIVSEKLIRRRQEALQQDIDSYVLNGAKEYLTIFEQYLSGLIGKPNVLFVKYEDMVLNFDSWLHSVSTHLGLDKHPEVLDAIRQQANFSVESEDKFSQKRQVTPGDHLRKLKPETISELNKRFGAILQRLGYLN
ncbi:MAG: sulfotransferase domain-containing protein [Anaerolineales bacterium]|nr:sulfotransferase domain-containing protein [Anaerolineales bacterium]